MISGNRILILGVLLFLFVWFRHRGFTCVDSCCFFLFPAILFSGWCFCFLLSLFRRLLGFLCKCSDFPLFRCTKLHFRCRRLLQWNQCSLGFTRLLLANNLLIIVPFRLRSPRNRHRRSII